MSELLDMLGMHDRGALLIFGSYLLLALGAVAVITAQAWRDMIRQRKRR
jgi:hypothetical protein